MSEDQLRAWMEVNRLNWDDRTAVHLRNDTDFYPIDQVRAGDNAFGEPEDSELGDVAGKRIVHLQCHFGLDSIRLARRGAIVTGLDFSTTAIAAARALAAELGVHARFVEGNAYDSPALLNAQYDIAFVTWGSIIWLPDIRRWAQIVAELLRAGGCTSRRGILRHCRSTRSTAGWSQSEHGGRQRTRPSPTMMRRPIPAIQRRSPTHGATNGVIR